MYYAFFGLSQAPFKITPDTDFFFEGGNRGAILEALIYAISQGEGIIKVTGEVGSGKTMLCRVLQARLPRSVETVYLANPSVSPQEILHAIAFELQLPITRDAGRLVVMHALNEYLLRRHAEGRQVVVFVEESQSMPIATLEEIRLLSNLETKQHKLLQIVLFGQPELDENLRKTEIRQLRERITHSFSLVPLNVEEVRAYLSFRLRAAGYHGPDLFTPAGIRYLTQATGGLTRRVNIVADKALLAAFAENTHNISIKHLRAAVQDSEFSQAGRHRSRPRWLVPSIALGALLVVGLGIFLREYGAASHPSVVAAPAAVAPVESHPVSTEAALPATAAPIATTAAPTAPAPAAVARPAEAPPAPATTASAPAPSGPAAPVPAPAPVPTPSAQPVSAQTPLSASSDPLEQRLLSTEHWLAEAQGAVFSIQLLGSNDPKLLRRYIEKLAKYIEIEKIFVYRTVANQQPSMTVLYGAFSSRNEAIRALEAMPDELKANKPYIRSVQGIRAEIGMKKPT
jgi:type II secretory pathway predicted ATPase ExeA